MLRDNRTVLTLSFVTLCLMLIVSAGGLLFNEVYRDNVFVAAIWRGNDWVTLAAAVPIFAGAMFASMRGSKRAEIVWLGMLDYTLYNFAFYLFAAAFNVFFMVYVASVTLSMFALLFALVNLDAGDLKASFRPQTPVKWIAGYMFFVALGLTAVYLIQFLGFTFSGQIPDIVLKTDHPTNIVPALDLTLLVPWLILGAIWLWKRKTWGFVISAILLVKATVYTLALAAAGYSAFRAGFPESMGELPLWGTLSVGFLLASVVLFGNFKPHNDPRVTSPEAA